MYFDLYYFNLESLFRREYIQLNVKFLKEKTLPLWVSAVKNVHIDK